MFFSPPCACWSRANTTITDDDKRRQRDESDKLIRKFFELVEKYKPTAWLIENPAHKNGLQNSKEMIKNLGEPNDQHFYDCIYCAYGFPYQKRTRFWTKGGLRLKIKNKFT